jgi:hypothetical protein
VVIGVDPHKRARDTRITAALPALGGLPSVRRGTWGRRCLEELTQARELESCTFLANAAHKTLPPGALAWTTSGRNPGMTTPFHQRHNSTQPLPRCSTEAHDGMSAHNCRTGARVGKPDRALCKDTGVREVAPFGTGGSRNDE